jgi:hypothetical protein
MGGWHWVWVEMVWSLPKNVVPLGSANLLQKMPSQKINSYVEN